MTTGTNNITDLPQTAISRATRIWEDSAYLVLLLIMAGQALAVTNIFVAQIVYLSCNILALARAFALDRPLAEKVKDTMCFGLTIAIILIRFVF